MLSRVLLALALAGPTVAAQSEAVDALIQRGDRERLQGDYRTALETYALARDRAEAVGDRPGVASGWNGLGMVYATQSDYPGALEALERGLAIREELGLRSDLASSLSNIGGVYRQLGRFADAIANHQRALTLLDGEGDARRRANTLNNLGVAHVAQGDYDEALAFYERSLALHEGLGNTAGVAGTLSNMGIVHRQRGNHAEALRCYQRGLTLGRQVGDRRLVADTLQRIGVLHAAQGNGTLAMQLYEQSLAEFRALGIKIDAARVQNNIGNLHARLGQHDLAEASMKEALRLREEIGDAVGIAESLNSGAGLARRRGDLDLAERLYDDGLRRYEALGDQRGIAQTLMGLHRVHSDAGRYERALDTASRAVAVARKIGDRNQLWQALTAVGRDQRALGDPQRARAAFTEAIATIESLRLDVAGGETDQQRAFESRLVPYHELLSIAITEGATAEAFRVAEQSKARVVLDILRSGRVDITTTMSDSEQAEERALNRRVANVSAQALAERRHARSDPLRVASLEGELARARLAREDFETRLYATHPDLRTQRGETTPATVDQAALVLEDSATAALEYVVTDRDVWLFVLTRSSGSRAGTGQLTVEHLPIAPRELTALVERLTLQLAERDLQFRATATQLYDALLRPVTAALAGRSKLIVVPDAALWQVPFQALWNSTTSRYVIETHAVAYAPSVTVLAETRRRRTDRGQNTADALDADVRPTLLAFGNPALAAPDSGTSRADRNASRAPLPAAEREVNALGQLYGAARSRVYTGAQAREDRLKVEAGRYSILHVATHGILDDASPMYSHVLLAPSPQAGGDDGELQAWEIARLQLGASLVVLSGCETARGRVAPGEGVIGLTWSLFVAGASTAVVSQWSVDSATTSTLMLSFHRRLTGGASARADSPARALQQAAIPLLRSSQTRHPFYWAAFVVVGDGFQ